MVVSNREVEELFDKYNPRNIRSGDRVLVTLHQISYFARIVGLELDIKNKKIYASLRLFKNLDSSSLPTRVDIADCKHTVNGVTPIHSDHNSQERKS